MKKSKIAAIIAATVLSVSAFGTVVAGCKAGEGEPYVFEYEVSVEGGTGSGTYKDGDNCSVTAEIPEGKKFDKWVNEYGEVLSVANPYTFKVEGDTEVYAVVSDMATYKVEVIGGTITGTSNYQARVYEGETVSVTASSSSSRAFKEWLIDGTEKSTQNPYTFTATKDISIEALYDESFLVAVSGGTIDGEDGKTSGIYESGEECTLTVGEAPVGLNFVYWYVLDENGNENFLSFSENYTFAVTGTDKYYAKFGNAHSVTVTGGIIKEYPEYSTVNVIDGTSLTVSMDPEAIPEGYGFMGWKVGEGDTVASLEHRFTVTEDNLTVAAQHAEQVKVDAPVMTNNQMLGRNDNYLLELDRGKKDGNSGNTAVDNRKTAFADNVDHVIFYIYTSPYADKTDYAGAFKLDFHGTYVNNNGKTIRFATLEGETLTAIEGVKGNMWLDTIGIYDGANKKTAFFGMLSKVLGDKFDANTPYYFAAQACGEFGVYSVYQSDISDIGPKEFIQNNVAKHTLNITGGTVKNANSAQVSVYAGTKIVILPATAEQGVVYGLYNGEELLATGEKFEYVVTGNLTLEVKAVPVEPDVPEADEEEI